MKSAWLLVGLVACGSKLPTETITVGTEAITVEIAATHESRQQGLMYRESLADDRGMLFVYNEAKPRSFWMKNVKIPLSIAYISPSGEIVRIAEMRPQTTESTPSLYPAQYALEMNGGWFERHKVEVGTKIPDLPKVEAE